MKIQFQILRSETITNTMPRLCVGFRRNSAAGFRSPPRGKPPLNYFMHSTHQRASSPSGKGISKNRAKSQYDPKDRGKGQGDRRPPPPPLVKLQEG